MSRDRKLPAVPAISSKVPREIAQILSPLKQIVEALQQGGVITASSSGSTASGGGAGVIPDSVLENLLDVTIPPAPTGVEVHGGMALIIVEFDKPAYRNHAYTEVWRADSDDFSKAALVGTTQAFVYSDSVGGGRVAWYWLRHVSTSTPPRYGPFNNQTGTRGETGQDATYVLDLVKGKLQDVHIAQVNAAKVIGTLQDWQIDSLNAAKLAGQLIDSQIAAVAAAKLTGQLADHQIANVAASKIAGQILDNQLAGLSVEKLLGKVQLTQLASDVQGSLSSAISTANQALVKAGEAATATSVQQLQGRLSSAELDLAATNIKIGTVEAALPGKAQAADLERLRAEVRTSGRNMLDLSKWLPGAGVPPGFAPNGATSEFSIVYSQGPFGDVIPVWRSVADGDGAADGGWNHEPIAIDPTKSYRFSVYVKAVSGNGSAYLGASPSLMIEDGAMDTNPYFVVTDHRDNGSGTLKHGKWYLLVGYRLSANYVGSQLAMSGVFDVETGLRVAFGRDWKALPGDTATYHRAYQYYATGGAEQQFALPRMEVLDGNEPAVADLLSGAANTAVQAVISRIARVESDVAGRAAASELSTLAAEVKASKPGGENLLQNSDLADGTMGWACTTDRQESFDNLGRDAIMAYVLPGYHSLTIHQKDAAAADSRWVAQAFVTPGTRYIASAFVSSHRARWTIVFSFRNENGVEVGRVESDQWGPDERTAAQAPWQRGYAAAIAPAGATRVSIAFTKKATLAGYGDSWIFLTKPMLEATESTQPSHYRPGSAVYDLAAVINATKSQLGQVQADVAGRALASDVTSLRAAVNARKTYKAVAWGGSAANTSGSPGIYSGGILIHGSSRSYGVAVFDGASGEVIDFRRFDVYGAGEFGGAAATMAAYLNSLSYGTLVMVLSHDEPKTHRLDSDLGQAMYRLGASPSIFGSSKFAYRSAYMLLGKVGLVPGAAYEAYVGRWDNDASALIAVSFAVEAGEFTGMTPAPDYTAANLDDLKVTVTAAIERVANVEATVAGKAAASDVSQLQVRVNETEAGVAGANQARIDGDAANASSISQVTARLAPGGDVNALIAGKASQLALDSANQRISNVETTAAGKASASDVATLRATVSGNARVGSAMNADPGCLDVSAWEYGGHGSYVQHVDLTDGLASPKAFRTPSGAAASVDGRVGTPVQVGKTYRISCLARKSADSTGKLYVRYVTKDATNATNGQMAILDVAGGNSGEDRAITTAWARYEVVFTVPAGSVLIAPRIILNWNNSPGYHEVQDIRLEEVITQAMVDGLPGALAAKAAQASLDATNSRIGNVEVTVGTKAAASDLSNLSAAVVGKASQSSLDATNARLGTVEATVGTKASASEFQQLSAKVTGPRKAIYVPGDRNTFYPVGVYVVGQESVAATANWRLSRPNVHWDELWLGSYTAEVSVRPSAGGHAGGAIFSVMQRTGGGSYAWGLGDVRPGVYSWYTALFLRGGMTHEVEYIGPPGEISVLMPDGAGTLHAGSDTFQPVYYTDSRLAAYLNKEWRPDASVAKDSVEGLNQAIYDISAQNSRLATAEAVLGTKAAATTVESLTAEVRMTKPTTGNLLQNSDLTVDASGWAHFGDESYTVFERDGANWGYVPAGRHTLTIHHTSSNTPTAAWYSAHVKVVGGKRHILSVYGQSHRSTWDLYIDWIDSAGTVISQSISSPYSDAATTGPLSSWTRYSLTADAPAIAVRAAVGLRKRSAGIESWVMWCAPMLEQSDATVPSPYVPGPLVVDLPQTIQTTITRVASVESTVAGKASASEVSVLAARVGTAESSVATVASVQADLSGKVTGKWGVVLGASTPDGRRMLSGVQAINDGTVSSFVVTADQLLVQSPGGALNIDPGFADKTAWVTMSGTWSIATLADGVVGTHAARSGVTADIAAANPAPFDRKKTYRIHAWARRSGDANGKLYLGVQLLDANGQNITGNGSYWYTTAWADVGTGWTEFNGTIGPSTGLQAPANAVSFRLMSLMNYSGTQGYMELQDFRIEEVIPGTLIKPGEITTNHLVAQAVTAEKLAAYSVDVQHLRAGVVTTDKLAAGAVTAVSIKAGEIQTSHFAPLSVTTEKLAAGAITADKLSVGSLSAISANLGTVVAGKAQNQDGSNFIDFNASGAMPFLKVGGNVSILANGEGHFSRRIVSDPDIVASGIWNGNSGWVYPNSVGIITIDTGMNSQGSWSDFPASVYEAAATISGGQQQGGGGTGYNYCRIVTGDGISSGGGGGYIDNRIYVLFLYFHFGAGPILIEQIKWKVARV